MKTSKAVEICPALATALQAQPRLLKIFATMPPSHQRQYDQWISGAKKEETQKSRAEKALEMIGEWGKQRR